jgi:hypothetical protein
MTRSFLGRADPEKMKLLSALTRDPNLIHLEGERPVNQGPIAMTWLMEQARRLAGGDDLTQFKIRFIDRIYAGDEVEFEVETGAPGGEITLFAIIEGRVVAKATAAFGRDGYVDDPD